MKTLSRTLALSTLGVLLACPAWADSQAQIQASPTESETRLSAEQFPHADINQDGKLSDQELKPLAAQIGADASQWLQEYDLDQDDALSQPEYSTLTQSGNLAGQIGSSQAEPGTGERSRIVVNQKPATVTVTKPAPQVTVTQPEPEVTITSRDPEVSVHQPEPQVSVQQAEPQVSVDAAEPTVGIEQAEPQVSVRQAEPEIQVQDPEPEIVTGAGQPAESAKSTALSEVPASNAASSGDALYDMPLQELRTGDVKTAAGESFGDVEDVVIRNDGGHAGLLITSADGDSVLFAPIESLSYQDGDLIIQAADHAEEIGDDSRYDISRYQSAPQGARTLQDAIEEGRVSAR